ncbi:MAG: flagellar cap protein FliD N-terminal domain-containing protein, partial [Kiloniellales bacterium]|nr:flagellar cap protein FliD N-terminal domain-containing protein [Kiloniellales bacterium]
MAISGVGGTVSFFDNRPLISGSFSGLDTAALLEAQLTIRRLPAVKLENRISENDTQIAALTELNSLLEDLRSSVNALRSPPGLTGIDSNIFERNSVFFSSDSATSATDILGATASNQASPGIFDIEVQQIATAQKVSSASIADVSAALGVTETLTIGVAGADPSETFDLSVDANTSAADIVSAVNTQSAVTGIRASIVQIASGDSRVVFTAVETNQEISIVGDNGGATLSALGVSNDNGATFLNELAAAQPAQLL